MRPSSLPIVVYTSIPLQVLYYIRYSYNPKASFKGTVSVGVGVMDEHLVPSFHALQLMPQQRTTCRLHVHTNIQDASPICSHVVLLSCLLAAGHLRHPQVPHQ